MSRIIAPLLCTAALSAFVPALVTASPIIVPWSARGPVDTDGDGSPDLTDFAPGVADNQMDTDNDHIGDIIDPTPEVSNPFIGDLVLGLYGPYTIPAGTHVFLDYQMWVTPPGAYGYIDLDLGADGIYDATYFGPLDTTIHTIDIAPSLFTSALWDLYTPGTYELHGLAYAPGMHSLNYTISGAIVIVPEPASLGAFAIASLLLARRPRRAAKRLVSANRV